MISSSGVWTVNSAQAARKIVLISALTVIMLRKPKVRMIRAASVFMPMAPTAEAKRHEARLERRQAEADLHQQRQQERQRADAEPEQEAADDGGAQGRQPQQGEVEHRRSGSPRMHHVKRHRDRADADQGHDHLHGSRLRPATESPKAMPARPMPASTRP